MTASFQPRWNGKGRFLGTGLNYGPMLSVPKLNTTFSFERVQLLDTLLVQKKSQAW